MIKRIATVTVYVESQQAALKFWMEQAGFEVRQNAPMGPEAFWIEVAPAGAESCLVLYPKKMMPDWNEQKAAIVFECTEFQETYSGMVARGVKFLEEPKSMPWGTFARFQDPDGNQFLLKG